jgi:hypothetical protein
MEILTSFFNKTERTLTNHLLRIFNVSFRQSTYFQSRLLLSYRFCHMKLFEMRMSWLLTPVRTVVTLSNARFNIQKFRILRTGCIFVIFYRSQEKTGITSLCSIKCFVFIAQTECVYCAVRTESLNIVQFNVSLQSVNTRLLLCIYSYTFQVFRTSVMIYQPTNITNVRLTINHTPQAILYTLSWPLATSFDSENEPPSGH